MNTNDNDNKIPKKGYCWTCLWVILIDSVLKMGKNYYPEMFKEEGWYIVKKKTIYW